MPLFLVANERPLLYLDATLLINIGLWIVLFVILRAVLWGPMVKLIAARESGTVGSRETAHTLEADSRRKKAEFEAAVKKARSDASASRDQLRTQALAEEARIVAEARAAMNTVVETQRAEIRKQREVLQTQIRATVPGLAGDIATKVLGREVRS